MTDYTGIPASAIHTRCCYGNVPSSLMTWHDQSHCRGEFPRYESRPLVEREIIRATGDWVVAERLLGVTLRRATESKPPSALSGRQDKGDSFSSAAPEPLAVLTARRERVLAGLMVDWKTPPYTRWARPAQRGVVA